MRGGDVFTVTTLIGKYYNFCTKPNYYNFIWYYNYAPYWGTGLIPITRSSNSARRPSSGW